MMGTLQLLVIETVSSATVLSDVLALKLNPDTGEYFRTGSCGKASVNAR